MYRSLLFLLVVIASISLKSQQLFDSKYVDIKWVSISDSTLSFNESNRMIFKDAHFMSEDEILPFYIDHLNLFDKTLTITARLSELVVSPVESFELEAFSGINLPTDFIPETAILSGRDEAFAKTTIPTLRRNQQTGEIERLESFKIDYHYEMKPSEKDGIAGFATTSVLASGEWFKFRLNKSGVYKISFSDLQAIGINPSSVNPKNIRIYGNGGGTLPENNSASRYDDLFENPIKIVGEEDGVFNQNDYILFYGQGPVVWDYDPVDGFFVHRPNYYDDYTYYYVTASLGEGKRMPESQVQQTSNATITSFVDYQLYEQDLVNLSNTGRTWYGDLFDVTLSKDFEFDFPNIDQSRQGKLVTQVAARSFGSSNFQLSLNGSLQQTIPVDATQATGYDWAKGNSGIQRFTPSSDKTTVGIKYNRALNSARGWLDYISLNVWRQLKFTGSQMHFNNTQLTGEDSFVTMELANASTSVEIWDVTEAVNPVRILPSVQASTLRFIITGSEIRQFIAFDQSSFFSVEKIGAVANQNLHSLRDIDYLIIAHPDFVEQAEQLAEIHRTQSGLDVFVTVPSLIYNEFSSGAQDVTAIRDFARMLYSSSSPGRELRYMLLFGDASFDYKDRISGNTNFVPTYEAVASLNLVNSIATDDYYGYLDTNEGTGANSLLDIGIGRFPVATATEAQQIVDKIIRYLSDDEDVMSPWRNEITFVSDDGDSNTHLNDAETIVTLLRNDYPDFNLDKIHLDAYKQVATPSGQKAPEVNEAINKRVERGSLIINYSGHGGEVGWTEERILQIADITSWRNRNKLPVFITATCEFSRYDDAERTSAGEMVFLNPFGGAIAMFTTARATYSTTNLRLNKAIFNDNIFTKINGQYPRFGDVIRKSKLTGDANDRKFVLLGDPALQISFPKEKVITTHINGNPVNMVSDTLKALDEVTVSGIIADRNEIQLTNFNGVLYATVYDKEAQVNTYGDQGPTTSFLLRNSIIHKSTVEVVNGHFEFRFMIPKDIAYKYGSGRISYYATDYQTDAQGNFEDFYVGGFSNNVVDDQAGPNIKLYIGDTTFVSGGFTDENPSLLALLADENGINTTGSGIGHDLVATLTGASERYAIINEFYTGKLNATAEGSVVYPFANLNPGKHTLTLKAWDILNNSNTATIEFEVILSNNIRVENLMNYPNPFHQTTSFVFDHNQSSDPLDVEISIYNTSGMLIKTIISENHYSNGYRSQPIHWNGLSDQGNPVAKGLYIYRLVVTNSQGVQTDKRAKLLYY
ncbi:MAG: hypothetical protein FD155_1440 [Bacteroidetes bacterium]|nr:MAG: hypothetical protein FD155_1440 [Bacteroidota bacterium]